MISNRICVLGTGSYATALSLLLSKNNNTIFMWGINQKEINDINSGYNKVYFGDHKFTSSLSATNDLRIAIGNSKYILLAVPSNAISEVLDKLKECLDKSSKVILINAIKGFDEENHQLLSKFIKYKLKGYKIKLVNICGPSLAADVFHDKPTIINAASSNMSLTRNVCHLFNNETFKMVPIRDLKGIQIYAALKNLLAIGIGMVNEQYDSINTQSALITIGIKELKSIGRKMGVCWKTINQYCGIGDIILTCTSNSSRNMSFGRDVYKKGIQAVLSSNRKTVEGYSIYKTVESIISRYNLNTPLFSSIIRVLNGTLKPENLAKSVWELVSKNQYA